MIDDFICSCLGFAAIAALGLAQEIARKVERGDFVFFIVVWYWFGWRLGGGRF